MISKYHNYIKSANTEKISKPLFSYISNHLFKGTSFSNFLWLIRCITSNACICLYGDCHQNVPLPSLITAIYGYTAVPCRRRSLFDPRSQIGGFSILKKKLRKNLPFNLLSTIKKRKEISIQERMSKKRKKEKTKGKKDEEGEKEEEEEKEEDEEEETKDLSFNRC